MAQNRINAAVFFPLLGGILAISCRSPLRIPPGEESRLPPRTAPILAGAAKEDLVPPWRISLAGYGRRQGAALEGVSDRPCARALWIRREGEKNGIAVVSADLLVIPEELRRLVLEKLGENRPAGLLLAATHSHSSLGNFDPSFLSQAVATGGFREPVLEFIAARIAKAVTEARRQEQPAKLGAAAGEAAGLSVHRRDDSRSIDPTLAVIRVEGKSGPIARIVSFAAHPTVLSPANRLLSGDFPGFLCLDAERRWGGTVLFLNAACAEIAPSPPRGGRTLDSAKRLGEALAAAAHSIDADIRVSGDVAMGFRSQIVTLPERRAAQALAFPLGYLVAPWILPQLPFEARLQVFTLGPVTLATFPCDFGVELGRRLRSKGAGAIIPVSYADGFIGYAIDEGSFEMGWYESRMSFYGPSLGSYLVEKSLALLEGD